MVEQEPHDDLLVTLGEFPVVCLLLKDLPSQVGVVEVHHRQPRTIHLLGQCFAEKQ